MLINFLDDLEKDLLTVLSKLKKDLNNFVVDKINLNLFDNTYVSCYDEKYSISQLSFITFEDKSVLIKPFEKKNKNLIYDSIKSLNMNLEIFFYKDTIKIKIPEITTERRESYVKNLKIIGEKYKVNIRNLRKKFNNKLKNSIEIDKISEDDKKKHFDKIDKLINNYIIKLDDILEKKFELLKI